MRYRVEKFHNDGRFIAQDFVMADSLEAAEELGMDLMGCQTFRERSSRLNPYIHVTRAPEHTATGPCTRCGEPRYRCGGETDPHE